MLTNYYGKTCVEPTISSEILYLASNTPQANVKIVHSEQLEPLAYAIGFGCKSNSSLIIGGVNERDWLSTRLLIMFARTLCVAVSQNNHLLGIDINEVFKKKGVWIIPKFNESISSTTAMNFIIDKIDPRQIIELRPGKDKIKYYAKKHNETMARLFAYTLAASCNYSIDSNLDYLDENNLCAWFTNHTLRPSYSLLFNEETSLNIEEMDALFDQILEGLLIFASS